MDNRIKFTEVRSLDKALDAYQQFLLLDKTQKIIFDFSDASFVYSNFSALFAPLLDSVALAEIIPPSNPSVRNVLLKNNFLPTYLKDQARRQDSYNTVIELQRFDLKDTETQSKFFHKLLQQDLLEKKGLTNVSRRVLKEVSQKIIELFENSREHSHSQQGIYIAGQSFPKKRKLDFTIVDLGVGIKHNVNQFLLSKGKPELSAADAIDWALVKQNSTEPSSPRGLGLSLLKELLMVSKGKLEIISADGMYTLENAQESLRTLNYCFNGTIVSIEFNIEKHTRYVMKGEL